MRRPRFIAKQAKHAKGPLGRLIAFIMARETWAENKRAIEALGVAEADHILDVGCGHGRSLGLLAAGATRGCVVGADPSDLMAEIAVTRNGALVKAGRVKVVTATAADLPFPDATFDKALCVHVIYFLKDLRTSFREIARVLKPGGALALLFRSTQDRIAVNSFPADVYRFHELAEVRAALLEEGFVVEAIVDAESKGAGHRPSPILLIATRGARRSSQTARVNLLWE